MKMMTEQHAFLCIELIDETINDEFHLKDPIFPFWGGTKGSKA
ncbi:MULTISPECIES: hypothetical protein [Peribacillus]|nr:MULTISPECIES: hypothetical protein [unclassified Peribacillus]